jgi:hypothetical protein
MSSLDLAQENIQEDITQFDDEGDGMTCLSVANIAVSGADDGIKL